MDWAKKVLFIVPWVIVLLVGFGVGYGYGRAIEKAREEDLMDFASIAGKVEEADVIRMLVANDRNEAEKDRSRAHYGPEYDAAHYRIDALTPIIDEIERDMSGLRHNLQDKREELGYKGP